MHKIQFFCNSMRFLKRESIYFKQFFRNFSGLHPHIQSHPHPSWETEKHLLYSFKLVKKVQETPSTISLHFAPNQLVNIANQTFSFKSGQWVDLFVPVQSIPKMEGPIQTQKYSDVVIAGFSMINSPQSFAKDHILSFAVKKTRHPITQYLHSSIQIGESIYISEGRGSFFFEKERFPKKPSIALLGGGIGITPLLSILQYIHSERLLGNIVAKDVVLVHSVRSSDEIVFQDKIQDIVRKTGNMKAFWTITREKEESHSHSTSRIDLEFLKKLNLDLTGLFFVCGPPPMVKDLVNSLHHMGVHSEQIHYEKWR